MFPDLSFDALHRAWLAKEARPLYRRSARSRFVSAEEELLSATVGHVIQIPDWLEADVAQGIEAAICTLTLSEQRVVRLRFGLDDGRWRTLTEIGRQFYLTRERIRQIETKALRKLRHPARAKRLLTPLIFEHHLEAELTEAMDQLAHVFHGKGDDGGSQHG